MILLYREILLTFLDLSFAIRERIYDYAGLFRKCPLDLDVWEPGQRQKAKDSVQDPEWFNCCCLKDKHAPGSCDCFLQAENYESVPIQLLRVAKEVSVKTRELLFSRNRF